MQAVLSANAIKPFTKALSALTKYGDEVDIHATPEFLVLSATNSSKSAYGRFRAAPEFFEKYRVGNDAVRKERPFAPVEDDDDAEEAELPSGQIVTKSILSILRSRGQEKNVERCEIVIVPGQAAPAIHHASGTTTSSMAADNATSILVIRLHCKYGVKKTHRLSLSAAGQQLSPHEPESELRSKVVVGSKAAKDIVDHFTITRTKGSRPADMQLVWEWGGDEVKVRNSRGLLGGADAQISTSITVDAEEFESYDVPAPTISLSFHLRELLAATSLAEGLSLPMEITFTEAAAPLAIRIDAESHDALFVLATKVPPGSGGAASTNAASAAVASKKRSRPEDTGKEPKKKSMKVVTVVLSERPSPQRRASSNNSTARSTTATSFNSKEPDPPRFTQSTGAGPSNSTPRDTTASPQRTVQSNRPLFHPISPGSQRPGEQFAHLSQADQEAIRASGLGLESMTAEEIAAMLEDDEDDDEFWGPPEGEQEPVQPPGDEAMGGLGEEERMEMELDPEVDDDDVDEAENGLSFYPMTQMNARVGRRDEKQFEALDFGDD